MKKFFPGVKPPRIPAVYHLSDLLPDPKRPTLKDVKQRNIYMRSGLSTEHTTLAVSNTVTTEPTGEPQRIRSAQVAPVSGGTVTVQVQVDGRDIFTDSERPVSGAAPSEAADVYVFPAGSVVTTIIEATSGVPAGVADVSIDTEPYLLLSKFEPVKLKGRERLKPSKRKAARVLNTNGPRPGSEQASRLAGYTAEGTTSLLPGRDAFVGPVLPTGKIFTTDRKRSPIKTVRPPGGIVPRQ